ncbi:DUF3885 domain-containing protein [Enterococcus cecorum]|uniref:DUF3885 domain-containing protein n=2 Tax=Enterococcus cecorum TaxID=44008 RepID=UPI00148E0931|nr:DUF3885 domain-containing protein [Enterococcus cecorum]
MKLSKSFHNQFTQMIKNMGIQSVYGPIFYQAKYGLRFEMGVGDPTDERFRIIPIYFEEAIHRALSIYQATEPYDILRINVWVDSEHESGIPNYFTSLGLPEWDESYIETYCSDGYEYQIKACYWDLRKLTFNWKKLFHDIVYTDFKEPHFLASNVFFLNTKAEILYHLYDDRGLDVVATDKMTLQPIYQNYHTWLLDYDREAMKKVFE